MTIPKPLDPILMPYRLIALVSFALLGIIPDAQARDAGKRSSRTKPLIGINMEVSDQATTNVNLSLRSTYVDAVTSAGGIPILLPPVMERSDIERLADTVDGFIFVGGKDVHPSRYGEDPHPAHNQLNPRREAFDFTLMKQALDSGKPILGVCLGMQELNIATGGTMIQDIPTETSGSLDHRPGTRHESHGVEIKKGTRLHGLVTTETMAVNSVHHQAVDVVSTGAVIVCARATDGIVEAIELPGKRFALGVQWHPEFLAPDRPHHLAIFEGLVNAARRSAARDAKSKASATARKKPRNR